MATKVNQKLEKAINKLLDDMDTQNADGTDKYGLIEKMRILDRGLKLEQIKKGLSDSGMGSEFGDDEDEGLNA